MHRVYAGGEVQWQLSQIEGVTSEGVIMLYISINVHAFQIY